MNRTFPVTVMKRAVQLIGPVLLIIIFIRFVDIHLMMETFRHALLPYLLLSFLLTIIIFLAKILRIYLPLRKSGIHMPFYSFAKLFVSARLLGWISNTFVSDVVNAGILMAKEEKKVRITNVFILNRMADIVATLIIFGITFTINSGLMLPYVHVNYRKTILFFVVAAVLFFIVFYFKSKALPIVKDFISTGSAFLRDIAALTTASVFCSILAVILNAKALQIDVAASFLMLCYSLGMAISVLPVSISGLGTREIAFIFLMGLVGIQPEKAIALSFLEFIVLPLLSFAAFYLCSIIGVRYENRYNR